MLIFWCCWVIATWFFTQRLICYDHSYKNTQALADKICWRLPETDIHMHTHRYKHNELPHRLHASQERILDLFSVSHKKNWTFLQMQHYWYYALVFISGSNFFNHLFLNILDCRSICSYVIGQSGGHCCLCILRDKRKHFGIPVKHHWSSCSSLMLQKTLSKYVSQVANEYNSFPPLQWRWHMLGIAFLIAWGNLHPI